MRLPASVSFVFPPCISHRLHQAIPSIPKTELFPQTFALHYLLLPYDAMFNPHSCTGQGAAKSPLSLPFSPLTACLDSLTHHRCVVTYSISHRYFHHYFTHKHANYIQSPSPLFLLSHYSNYLTLVGHVLLLFHLFTGTL